MYIYKRKRLALEQTWFELWLCNLSAVGAVATLSSISSLTSQIGQSHLRQEVTARIAIQLRKSANTKCLLHDKANYNG